MSSSVIGALRVTLGLDSAEFTRGTKQAQVQMTSFEKSMQGLTSSAANLAKGLVAGAAFAGISALASEAFEMGSALTEASQNVGVTVEALQELRFAASQTGVSSENLTVALVRISKAIGDLELGKSSAVAAFKTIGLSVDDLRNKKPEEAIGIIADALNKLPNEQQRIAAGSAIMGRGFAQLLPLIKEGSAGLERYAEESRKNGQISTEDAAKLDELADGWEKFKTRLAVGVASIIADTASAVQAFDNFFVPVNNWVKEFDANAAQMASNAVASMQRLYAGVKTWLQDKLGAVYNWVQSKTAAVGQYFYDLYDKVVGHSYIPDMVDGIAVEMARLDKVMVDPAEKATVKTAEAHRQMAADIKQTLDGLFPELAALADYNEKIALITKSNLDDTAKLAAKRRLFSQFKDRLEPAEVPVPTVTPDNEQDLFDQAEQQIADYLETWQYGVRKTQKMNDQFTDSFADMARDVTGYFGNLVRSIKDGDFFSIVDSVLGLLSSIGRATGGFNIGPLQFPGASGSSGGIPGFANGGAMKLGGFGGIDRNVISMNGRPLLRASRGETLQIKPQNDGGASGGFVRIMVQANDYFDARVSSQAGRVVAASAQPIAGLGSNMAQRSLAQRGSRRLA